MRKTVLTTIAGAALIAGSGLAAAQMENSPGRTNGAQGVLFNASRAARRMNAKGRAALSPALPPRWREKNFPTHYRGGFLPLARRPHAHP
jgi:hypothetical protein